ncbi:MAG: ABC transporter ATP-binding protein [Chloroflexales bacterium]|nr:ABC transporter ATP-binding protein [Chloroflexales bacterium]
MLVIIGLTLVIPRLIQRVVDEGIGAGDPALLVRLVAALLGLSLLKGVLAYGQGRWAETASQGVAYDLRGGLHRQLLSLSFSYHDRAETGQLLSRALQDVERVRFLTGRAFLRIVEAVVLLLGTAAALAAMNPSLALLALGTMPLLAYRALVFGRSSRPLSHAIQNQLAVLTTRLEQNLRGARVVKAFAQEEAEVRRFVGANDRWFDLSARYARLQAINTPLLDLIANLGTVFIIWYGGTLVAAGALTVGELVAFSTYGGQLISPVRRLGTIIPAVADAAAAGDRVFEILDAKPEVRDAPGATALASVRGQVQFEHVSFSYFGRHQVLHDITFTAEPGQVIALLGATGSGKSTIINLLPRFYDPGGGRITIDGQDIRSVTLASLRDQISIVLQESTLFAASVRENIAFGCPGASDQAIQQAARTAQAHDFITALPHGYDTEVGERGVMLSGGQKQRVAIARALLRDPRILILDDATASVDTQTEHQIQLALRALMRGRTSFVIAQRLSTLREADQILVLERGRIASRGTHQELLQTSGLYAEIAARQLRPERSEAAAASTG